MSSASWWSCANRAFRRRTSSRASARSARSARRSGRAASAALTLALAAAAAASGQPAQEPVTAPPAAEPIEWRESRAVGKWWAGRLIDGVQLPSQGADFFTWDPVLRQAPNRGWRRWGTDTTLRRILRVVRNYRLATPWAPRVGVGDLSRPRGGPFGRRFGGLGHQSHQNGLDVDVVYPRLDGLEREPRHPSQVDEILAQNLVDRFVAAGAIRVFVGPGLRLTGPRRIVRPLVHHDDHMHVRFRR